MIQITPQMRILLAIEPADFRCGIDGLGRLCRERLDSDPMSGAMFVFRNRRATALRCLIYDGQGFCIWSTHCAGNGPAEGLLCLAPTVRGGSGRPVSHACRQPSCALSRPWKHAPQL